MRPSTPPAMRPAYVACWNNVGAPIVLDMVAYNLFCGSGMVVDRLPGPIPFAWRVIFTGHTTDGRGEHHAHFPGTGA